MIEWLGLLAPKALLDFSPEEFKAYVRGLKQEGRGRKPKTIRLKKVKPPFSWKITKTGKISVKVNRTPPWLSREEIAQISKESGVEERLVWLQTVSRKKNPVRLGDQSLNVKS